MKLIYGIGLTVVTGLLGMGLFIYSGLFDVSAATRDSAFIRWALENTRKNSIQARLSEITTPDLTDINMIAKGAKAFDEICASCHGGPGTQALLGTADMNPTPPELSEIADKRSEEEVFWVIKNGIRMTGMPAWGRTHNDQQLWEMTAFVKKLPDISDEQYLKLASSVTDDGHDHDHGKSTVLETNRELNSDEAGHTENKIKQKEPDTDHHDSHSDHGHSH